MDRGIIYPGQVPLETDLLFAQKSAMIGLAKLSAAVLGTSTVINGMSVGPTSPATLNVIVQPGEIYALANIDGTAYSSIAADTTHQVLKQGIMLDAATLACAAPGTAGFSINYLIQATFSEVDGTPVALPYYNASNPATAYSGPNNSNTAQNTRRLGTVVLNAKAGISAATGTQTTPSADAGYVGIAVVTVANGQTTITSVNITALSSSLILSIPAFAAQLASSANGSGADLIGGVGRVVSSIAALKALLKTGVGKAFVLGYYAAGDGGGGAYYYDSTDTTSADNGGTIIVASDGGRWKLQIFDSVSVKQFGVKADAGTTDNSTSLANAAAWLAANATRYKLTFPSGIYGYSVSPNWAINHARVIANGEVRLRYSGTGNAVIIDAGSGAQNIYDVTFGTPGEPFIIEPASTALNGCYVRAVHHSQIWVKPRGAGSAYAGLRVEFAVVTTFGVTCSVNEDGGWYADNKPAYGIYCTLRNAAEQVSYCSFPASIIEGPGIGIYLDWADGNLFNGGTSEGCTTGGVFETANARGNKFVNMDLEQNTNYDLDSSGIQTTLDQTDTNKLVTLRGNDQVIKGGYHSQLTVAAGALYARLHDLRYNRLNNGSTISDSGTSTDKNNQCINAATGVADAPTMVNVSAYGKAVQAPAAGTSPWTYQNTNAYPVEFIAAGGTISNIQFSRDNVTYYSVTGATNGGAVRLAPGDYARLTYSVVPTICIAPM
jgi:hypothetical protein